MKVLLEANTGQIEEKCSTFIAHLCRVSDVDSANEFINSVKKEYWDAKHNCYAFIIGSGSNAVTRCSDDGEPAKTAGRPILDVLTHSELTDICCVVTRYFGGTLLGTGGLVRAYTDATNAAIDNSVFGELIEGHELDINIDYSSYTPVEKYLKSGNADIINTEYAESITITIRTTVDMSDAIIGKITEMTNGTAVFSEISDVKYIKPINDGGQL